MSSRINFGIDLGTTNSAIARYHLEAVELVRNPSGLRQLLPSVVAKRGDRIIVGEKAREWLKRDSSRVFSAFKRKMGTTHSFHTPAGETFSPEQLSAYVLQELKQFLPVEEQPGAAVITIPASFDSVQAQATIRAGELAGFSEVRLLQEPIAASLAYANKGGKDELLEGQWLVYDLGGGTFDVALVRIQEGEMNVVDHEGDNFLGGTDIDLEIVMKILLPELHARGNFEHLDTELRTDSGRYQGLLQKLMLLAEDAKIELSSREATELELELKDEDGKSIDLFLTITQAHLEPILTPLVDRTVKLVNQVFERNHLKADSLNTILLVGGTTYIPFVREQLAQQLGLSVSTDVDPTTVVAVGAAHYASTIEVKVEEPAVSGEETTSDPEGISVKYGYQKVTQDEEEFVVAEITNDQQVAFYRFLRNDGGFDTGLQSYDGKIKQYVKLLPDSTNQFSLRLFSASQKELTGDIPAVKITQGNYALQGQPLPLDICVEVDDLERKSTRLEVVFPRNTLLPVRKTITRQISRSISKESGDSLTIKVLEGEGAGIPAAALPIGHIRLEGQQLERDLVRGSDVEITLEMDESRILTVEVYLMMTDQTIQEVFIPEKRAVDIQTLRDDLRRLMGRVKTELQEAERRDQFDLARGITDLEFELIDLIDGAAMLSLEDVTDARYQIEDRLRKIAGELHARTKGQELVRVKEEYFSQKRVLEHVLEEYEAGPDDHKSAKEILAEEKLTLSSDSSQKIRLFTERLQNMTLQVRWRSSKYVRSLYIQLKLMTEASYLNPQKARELFTQGDEALQQHNDHQLRVVINQLFDLLPREKLSEKGFFGTGLG